jgi:hypothetical protein
MRGAGTRVRDQPLAHADPMWIVRQHLHTRRHNHVE